MTSTESRLAAPVSAHGGRIRTVVIYAPYSKPMICYSLYPLLINPAYRITLIRKTANPTADLARLCAAPGDLLLCAGILRGVHVLQPEIVSFLEAARKRFARVVYFDDQDSCMIHSSPYMHFFDRWLKKQIYSSLRQYERDFLGGRIYAQYFCRAFAADPVMAKAIQPVQKVDLASIRLAWSICVGVYPLSLAHSVFAISQRLPLWATRVLLLVYHYLSTLGLSLRSLLWSFGPLPRRPICLARFDEAKYSPSIGYQRKLYRQLCRQHPGLFATDKVPLATYQRELFWSQACLSPFGWGEVCFRDSEAIRAGAVLVKPSMRHLQAWPDLYAPDRAVTVDWRGARLVEDVTSLLQSPGQARRLRRRACLALIRANLELPARVRRVLED
ncbi:MAG: hypothetical protein VKK97_12000 [Synechococcaceae cyanobacterium]|nr:hypothetical protein [Synechococcaceae cyanobacterium]